MKIPQGSPLQVSLRWRPGDEQPVGRLAYRNRLAYFEFDGAFLASSLQLSPVHHESVQGLVRPHDIGAFEGLHGLFNDSLPDGWGRLLVDRRARQLGIDPATLTPLDRLACVGAQGIGALCYAPATEVWGEIEPPFDLDRLAAGARTVLQGSAEEVISELGRAGGSPGGARPKALVAIDADDNVIAGTDSVPESHVHYLVKFRGDGDPADAARIEQAYADMARVAGVRMPETRLLQCAGGELYFASRRFDRDGEVRLHAHTASGLLYADIRLPSLDYRDLIALTQSITRDRRESRAMFALAAFNVMAHNRDDHARQFTWLMGREGIWRLAPAYDLTFTPGPGGEHSTSVQGHGKSIAREHLTALGRHADLRNSEIFQIVDRVAAAVATWPDVAGSYDVSARSRNRIAGQLRKTRLAGLS
ncbi:MAG: type II toxin-antitoxin system HipA family toxin [Gammaproteobacteria bacterium]|nr:type II toxin-antitoxin system HipA family toxin [Gammaproteobacteria bacterium]MDE0365244.1 type II toxin-antitoxin system HipA family toxin [Gammaproteobacteria bacterium]